jgi:hypothetical protein
MKDVLDLSRCNKTQKKIQTIQSKSSQISICKTDIPAAAMSDERKAKNMTITELPKKMKESTHHMDHA